MKLIDLCEAQSLPIYAWLEPAVGPNNLRGVALHYIQPLQAELDRILAFAQKEADEGDARAAKRVQDILKQKQQYEKSGQKFFTPDLDWWKNEDDFYAGREGAGGRHQGEIMVKYPNMKFVDDKNTAIAKATESGLF